MLNETQTVKAIKNGGGNGNIPIPKPDDSLTEQLEKQTTPMATTRSRIDSDRLDDRDKGVVIPYAMLGLLIVVIGQFGGLLWFLASASKDIQFNRDDIQNLKRGKEDDAKLNDTRFDLLERKMDKAEEDLKRLKEKGDK